MQEDWPAMGHLFSALLLSLLPLHLFPQCPPCAVAIPITTLVNYRLTGTQASH